MDYDFPPESRNDQADEWRKMYLEQKAENERLRAELARWEEVAAKIPRLRGAYEQKTPTSKCVAEHMGGKRCFEKCLCPKDCCEIPLGALDANGR